MAEDCKTYTKEEAFELITNRLADEGLAQEKQKKLEYVIIALSALHDAYHENPEIAREVDDSTARQIVHQSLVDQTMRDPGDTYLIYYIEKYMGRLF